MILEHRTPPKPLSIKNLSAFRGGHMLWHGLSFEVLSGSAHVITGPNGIGKTSLLRILAGFLRPHVGTVQYGATLIRAPEDWAVTPPLLHWCDATSGLTRDLTLGENIDLLRRLAHVSTSIPELAALVDVENFLKRPFHTLSSGQQQRVRLLRLKIDKRPLWILDEPLAHLDATGVKMFETHMQEHLAHGGQVVMTTHRPLAFTEGVHTLSLEPYRCA